MNKLEKAKEIITANINHGLGGIFDTRNTVGDEMRNLYNGNGLVIDVCCGFAEDFCPFGMSFEYEDGNGYFEVFGLSEEEFDELYTFYRELLDKYWGVDEE